MAQAVSRRPLPRSPGFDSGSFHVGIVVDQVALGQVFPRVLRLSPVNFITPVLHYMEKRKKETIIIFITGLHNKSQGCGASVATAAKPFTTKRTINKCFVCGKIIFIVLLVLFHGDRAAEHSGNSVTSRSKHCYKLIRELNTVLHVVNKIWD